MAKDKHARRYGELTVLAIANLIGSLVDTMRESGVPNSVVHGFLDRLHTMNRMTLTGTPRDVLVEIVDIIRGTVPGND